MKKRNDFQALLELDPNNSNYYTVIANSISTMLSSYFRTTEQLMDLQHQLNMVFPDMPETFVLNCNSPSLIIKKMARWIVTHHPHDWHLAFDEISIHHKLPSISF